MNYTYIIIEDNPGAVKNLQIALKSHENFREKGIATTLSEAKSLLGQAKPHLVFLDVELGNENGLDLAQELGDSGGEIPYLILITDYEKYAKNAINGQVHYFLDKPIDPDELSIALHKFEKRFLNSQNHITIKNTEGHFFVQLNSILYLKSDNNYCRLFRIEGAKFMSVSKTLKEMETILPNKFLRIHKSYIVNPEHITMLNTTKKIIRLCHPKTGTEVALPIGESYLENVKTRLLTGK